MSSPWKNKADYTVRAPKHHVALTFDRLQEQRGIHAEISITLGKTVLLDSVSLGLQSDSAQTNLVKTVKEFSNEIPWKIILQRACTMVLRRYREGEPLRILTVDTRVEPLTFQINPLVFREKATVLFGDGGLGKSSLALFCGMLISTGETVAGLSALPGVALYLDYEDSYDVHVRRMQAIAAAHPALARANVLYQACTEPLASLTHTLLRRIQAEGITFVVLDSLAAATGGDAGAEASTKVFRAMRTLNTGTLIVAHIPKPNGEGTDPSIYGSVFHKNFARSTWELRKEQEVGEDTAILGLFNRKSNLSRLHLPIGLKVTQNSDNTMMMYELYDLTEAVELATALPLPNRIRNLLEDGDPRSSKEIADALEAPLTSIKAVLSKHKGTKWHMIGENREAKWTVLNR
ncbi:MAG: AAA family ATPase [Nitrospirales bacterium]